MKKTRRLSRVEIAVDLDHPLIHLAHSLNWNELLGLVETIRQSKVKTSAGRPPNLRPLIGAVILRSRLQHSYRDEEDLIRHYVPARFLCGLMETDWTPAKSTIWDFEEQLGEDGKKAMNEFIVKLAAKNGFADPDTISADTTCQEASIPHPNEMGLMATFLRGVSKGCAHVGRVFGDFAGKLERKVEIAKKKIRSYRLFAKTTEKKAELNAQMVNLIGGVQKDLARSLCAAKEKKSQLFRYANVAMRTIEHLHETMKKLLPQIRYWLKTGRVAANKIISMYIPETYAIVRGKVGKTVEFGLNWGIVRLRGGYLLATCAKDKKELHDTKFAVRAVDDHIRLFKKPPKAFNYDRGADCSVAFETLKKRKVKHIGIARKGKKRWWVRGKLKERGIKERAMVEGGIGTIKTCRYRFNRPAARSKDKMANAGQGAVLGFNINKLIRDLRPPPPS